MRISIFHFSQPNYLSYNLYEGGKMRFSLLLIIFWQYFKVTLCNFEILILHTNDMHSRFDETNVKSDLITDSASDEPTFGGFARLKTAVDEAKASAAKENLPTLFLNAGDTFQGTAFYTLLKDEVVADMLPVLGIDVMSLGNHEFDDGPEALARFLQKAQIPTVAANVDFKYEPKLQNYVTKYIVKEINGVKIGVIGYLTTDTKNVSKTGESIFTDEIESIRTEAAKLKKDGVNIIIALGHSGIDIDEKIAREVSDVSLVIGGHTHTFLYNPPGMLGIDITITAMRRKQVPVKGKTGSVPSSILNFDAAPSIEPAEGTYPIIEKQSSGKEVPVVTAYAHTKYLGKLWITFDDNGTYVSVRPESNAMLIDSKIQKDEQVQDRVSMWRRKINTKMIQVLGVTRVYLDGWRASCKILECNLGNMLTDSFVDYVAEKYDGTGWTDAPIAITDSKSMKMSKNPNKIPENMTYDEILTLLPRKTTLYKLKMKGSILRGALEHSVARYSGKYDRNAPNEFLQVSGIHVTYDVSKPPHKRVVIAEVRCGNCTVPKYAPLTDNETIVLIIPEFLADGGHNYHMLKTQILSREKILGENGENYLSDTDCLARFIQKNKVVYPEISGRITILNANQTAMRSSTVPSSILCSKYFTIFIFIFMFIFVFY